MGTMGTNTTANQNETIENGRHLRDTKNAYKMMWVRLYRTTLDIMLFYLAFVYFRYRRITDLPSYGFRYNYFVTIGYGVLLYWFKRTYNAELFGFVRIRILALSQFLSQFFATTMIYVGVSIGWQHLVNPSIFILLLIVQFSIDILWSYYGSEYFFTLYPTKKTLLIYRNDVDRKRFGAVKGKPIERLHEIVDEIEFDGSFSEIKGKLDQYDAVFVAGVNADCCNDILTYCKKNGIPGFFLPHIGDVIMRGATHIQSFDSPVLYVNRKVVDPVYAFVKRTLDILSSGIALIILSPIMLVTALVVHLYDKGPALYKQTRLTKNGKEFQILKFRSMRVDAEKDGVPRLSSGDNDNRITPIGRFIRKCRIDELPQLINIFIGDMSVVGPRPERPEIAEQYYETMPDFALRLQVRAGLTGYAQVYGKYNTDPYEKLEFDLLYMNQMNLMTDIHLCFATFFVLFQKESTEGIEAGQTTAMTTNNHTKEVTDYKRL